MLETGKEYIVRSPRMGSSLGRKVFLHAIVNGYCVYQGSGMSSPAMVRKSMFIKTYKKAPAKPAFRRGQVLTNKRGGYRTTVIELLELEGEWYYISRATTQGAKALLRPVEEFEKSFGRLHAKAA